MAATKLTAKAPGERWTDEEEAESLRAMQVLSERLEAEMLQTRARAAAHCSCCARTAVRA